MPGPATHPPPLPRALRSVSVERNQMWAAAQHQEEARAARGDALRIAGLVLDRAVAQLGILLEDQVHSDIAAALADLAIRAQRPPTLGDAQRSLGLWILRASDRCQAESPAAHGQQEAI